jgi:hypothetical protein
MVQAADMDQKVGTSVLASSAIDCGFDPRSDQTKDYKTDICCFSAKPTVLRGKYTDYFAWN